MGHPAPRGGCNEGRFPLFASGTGGPLDVGNLTNRSFRPLLERAGLPRIRFYDLRHTCATICSARASTPR